MDFTLCDDRRMLKDSLTRYLADHYGIQHRNAVAYEAPYSDPAKWGELAQLGILFALVPPAKGGLGGGGFDIAVVFEALGGALCPEPVLAALMATRILHGDLDDLLSGQRRYGVVLDGDVDVSCDLLSGRGSVVYGGQIADNLLVNTKAGVFEIAADTARVTGYGMIDGGGAAEVFLNATPGRFIDNADVQGAVDAGALALCAEAVGAMDVSLAMLTDYVKTRKQFGRAIGDFQALQHRMVDLLTEIEQARSITILAASQLDQPGGMRVVSMAKSLVGRVAKQVSEELIQMHGGIAMTWEHPASHYAKRLVMIDHQLGDSEVHLTRVAAGYQAT